MAKKKASQKSSAGGLFSGKAKPAASKKSSKTRTVVQLTGDAATALAVMVAGKVATSAIKKKTSMAEARAKKAAVDDWCETFARTGARPDITTYEGDGGATFDLVVSRAISVTQERVKALELLGINLEDHTEATRLKVDVKALEKHGLLEKLQEFIEKECTDAQVAEIFEPVVELEDTFLDTLDKTVAASLKQGEGLADKMKQVVEILSPTSSARNPKSKDSEADSFDLVLKADVKAAKAS